MGAQKVKLSPAQQKLYDEICRIGHDRVVAGYKPAAKLEYLGFITVKEESLSRWHLRPARYAPGYPTRADAVKAARAFYAKGSGVLGIEGSDFRIHQTDEGLWNFEAGLDGESN